MNFSRDYRIGFPQLRHIFGGRAPRSEFWYWTLFAVLVYHRGRHPRCRRFFRPRRSARSGTIGRRSSCFFPASPSPARRLHDLDRTAWWLLIIVHGIGRASFCLWSGTALKARRARTVSAPIRWPPGSAGADQLDRLVLSEQIEQMAQRFAARRLQVARRATESARRRRARRRDICRGFRGGRCGSRAGRSGACRARRLRRAAANPPRRCGSRLRSRAGCRAAPWRSRRAAPCRASRQVEWPGPRPMRPRN